MSKMKSLEVTDKELDVLHAALRALRNSFDTKCVRGSILKSNDGKINTQVITREEVNDILGKVEVAYFDI